MWAELSWVVLLVLARLWVSKAACGLAYLGFLKSGWLIGIFCYPSLIAQAIPACSQEGWAALQKDELKLAQRQNTMTSSRFCLWKCTGRITQTQRKWGKSHHVMGRSAQDCKCRIVISNKNKNNSKNSSSNNYYLRLFCKLCRIMFHQVFKEGSLKNFICSLVWWTLPTCES